MVAFWDYAGIVGAQPGGHYRMGFTSGALTGLTAGQYCFAFRWTDAVRFCRLRKVETFLSITTAYSTAQVNDLAMFRAVNWTTAPTAGATLTIAKNAENSMADIGVTTPMASLNSLMPAAALAGNVAISSTGALTTGSPTIDGNAISYAAFNIIALGTTDSRVLYDVSYGIDYPLTFGQNEGFLIAAPTAQGSTGVVLLRVNLVFSVNNAPF